VYHRPSTSQRVGEHEALGELGNGAPRAILLIVCASWEQPGDLRDEDPRASILIVSDRRAAGVAEDETGPELSARLAALLPRVTVDVAFVPDEEDQIVEALEERCRARVALVLTSGGTGFGPRDVTPEATRRVIERPASGLVHALLAAGLAATPKAMLGRPEAGVRGRTLIVNLPGSPRGAVEGLDALAPALPHALAVLRSAPGDDVHPVGG
jgi:molybdopterin adenylyltransferase